VAAALLVVGYGRAGGGSGAGIDLRSTFDDSSISPWSAVQREFDRPLADSFQIVSTPARSGGSAAMFIARQGYSAFGYNEDSELCCGPVPREAEGSDYWYAWSTLFPVGWVAPYRWGIFLQWHSDWGLPPPLDFNTSTDSVWLQIHAGAVASTDCASGCGWEVERNIQVLKTLSVGRWNDFILHVHWSAYPRGSVEIWHRVAGEPRFQKVLTLRRVPTMQRYGSQIAGMYTLWGFYRGSYCTQPTQLGCTSPRGTQPDRVIYQDDFRRSTTMFPSCLACRSPQPTKRP
jgi:hypothetical protein